MPKLKNIIRFRKRGNVPIFRNFWLWLRLPPKMFCYRNKLLVFYIGPVVIEVGPNIL